jgi:hypothetical protein
MARFTSSITGTNNMRATKRPAKVKAIADKPKHSIIDSAPKKRRSILPLLALGLESMRRAAV